MAVTWGDHGMMQHLQVPSPSWRVQSTSDRLPSIFLTVKVGAGGLATLPPSACNKYLLTAQGGKFPHCTDGKVENRKSTWRPSDPIFPALTPCLTLPLSQSLPSLSRMRRGKCGLILWDRQTDTDWQGTQTITTPQCLAWVWQSPHDNVLSAEYTNHPHPDTSTAACLPRSCCWSII